jgi:UDP-N-acetylmuramate dehydrogenase
LSSRPKGKEVEPRDLAALIKICPRGVRPNVEMRTLTTMKVGGRADVILEPASPEQIKDAIGYCEDKGIPWTVMGRGSNLIVRDGGIRGVVMKIGPRMSNLSYRVQKGKVEIIAWAGLPLKRLLREAVRNGWGGMDFLAGIPGTVGGAVVMNAGGRDQAMGTMVKEVAWLDGEGRLERKGAGDLGFQYRSSGIPHGVVLVEVRLEAPIIPRQDVVKGIRERMEKRLKTQPLGCPSSGCIFKNPPGESAGRLIEEAGLKGLRVGGAIVSHKHANFIINEGDARASHVLDLMALVRQKVAQRTGIWLEPEVKVVGEDG